MAHTHICGCWFSHTDPQRRRTNQYLPQVKLRADTTILVTTSRTKLQQTFLNNTGDHADEVNYTFPLYDGVSVVSFKCIVDGKVILGVVKEREEARQQYEDAVAQGQSAGLFEQSLSASDVFTTRIGNIPNGAEAQIEIEYIGELKHDAELDGVRFTIPTSIAPRYGDQKRSGSFLGSLFHSSKSAIAGSIDISVDVVVEEGAHIEGLTSPSHPIAMKLGRTSTQPDQFRGHLANATLALGSAALDKDFVIVIHAQGHETPRALVETHPSIPNHRALMATLVPKFNLPNNNAEIVFVVDRSGSMGNKMSLVNEALKLFLRSLPYSAKFNIVSFGSSHTSLFDKSRAYDEASAQIALHAVQGFRADMGGTEMLAPLQAAVRNRLSGIPLEIMLLTDGQVWNQQQMFDYINEASERNVRLFSLGIGDGASTAQIEGLARAGNGFAQFAKDGEKIDKRLMRMLKAALSPHINDYHLEVAYGELVRESGVSSGDDDFEMIETTTIPDRTVKKADLYPSAAPISLFDANFTETAPNPSSGRYDHLPKIQVPKQLQAPCKIGGLFSFSRTCVYLLLEDSPREIKSVTLAGSFNGTPLRLDLPVQDVGIGQTIHQLAAKKAMLETEEGRGWLSSTASEDMKTLKKKHQADWDKITEREAARLGTRFQVAGKFCSFVAIEQNLTEKGSASSEKVVSTQQSPPSCNEVSQIPGQPNSRRRMDLRQRHSLQSLQNQYHDQGLFGARAMLASGPPTGNGMSATLRFGQMSPTPQMSQPPFAQQAQQMQQMQQMQVQSAQSLSRVTADQGMPFSQMSQHVSQPAAYGAAPPPAPSRRRSNFAAPPGNGGHPDYQAQLQMLEQQNKKRMMMARQEDPSVAQSPASSDQPVLASPMVDARRERKRPVEKKRRSAPSTALFGARMSSFKESSEAAPSPPSPKTSEDTMHVLIGLQRFDGSWQFTDQLLKLMAVKKEKHSNFDFVANSNDFEATVLVLAWLEKKQKDDKEVWEMIADKARNWLLGQQGVTDVDALVQGAIGTFFS